MTDSKNKKTTRSSIFSKSKSAKEKGAAPKSVAPKAESKPEPKAAPKPFEAAKKPEPKPEPKAAPKPAPEPVVAKAAPKCPEVTARGGTKAKMEQCLAVLEWHQSNGSSQVEVNAASRAYKRAKGTYLVTKSRFPQAYDD